MRRLCMTFVIALFATSVVGVQAQDERARGRDDVRWGLPRGYIPGGDWNVEIPFQIFDNVYFVGNEAVSSYLITTSDGLVLIDATNGIMVNRTLDNIRQLGFDPQDLKYVFVTEAHEIHYGGQSRSRPRRVRRSACRRRTGIFSSWRWSAPIGSSTTGRRRWRRPGTTRSRMGRSSPWATRSSRCTPRRGTPRERAHSHTSATMATGAIAC